MITQLLKFYKNGKFPKFLFLLFTSINVLISIYFDSIFIFIFSEIITLFYLADIMLSPFQFSIYQLMLLFSWISLTIGYGSNFENTNSYLIAYKIHFIHFVCVCIGYNLIKYKKLIRYKYKSQSILALLFLISMIIFSIYNIFSFSKNVTYSEQFPSYEETLNLPIYSMGLSSILSYLQNIFLFSLSNPLTYSFLSFIESCISYFSTGVKGGILSTGILLLIFYQFRYRKFSISTLNYLIPLGFFFIAALISTTIFRIKGLGYISFFSLTISDLKNYLLVFPNSPELSQVRYTSLIIDYINSEVSSYRYGWDYYRFFLYPFKSHFANFEYASYNQFVHLLNNKKSNSGLYIGLGGELFWNFGYCFFIFSIMHGYFLKLFQNWVISGSAVALLFYYSMYHTILWHYYRGQGNALILTLAFFIPAYLLYYFLLKRYIHKIP